MTDSVFTKIIKREIPATIIYEDQDCMAFLDINPVSLGHTLVISKVPYVWMDEVPDDLLGKLFIQAKKIMRAMKNGLACDYVQVSVVGKDVPHFHIHLMPRYKSDGLVTWNTKKYEDDTQKNQIAEKIKKALQ